MFICFMMCANNNGWMVLPVCIHIKVCKKESTKTQERSYVFDCMPVLDSCVSKVEDITSHHEEW